MGGILEILEVQKMVGKSKSKESRGPFIQKEFRIQKDKPADHKIGYQEELNSGKAHTFVQVEKKQVRGTQQAKN